MDRSEALRSAAQPLVNQRGELGTLLADLSTLARNTAITALYPAHEFVVHNRSTKLQQKALDSSPSIPLLVPSYSPGVWPKSGVGSVDTECMKFRLTRRTGPGRGTSRRPEETGRLRVA
jgi:hypothetical protein